MNGKTFAGIAFLVLVAVATYSFVSRGDASSVTATPDPTAAAPAPTSPDPTTVLAASTSAPDDVITVYKSPTCGCCGAWIEHLRENGFTVEVVDEPAMAAVKQAVSMPAEMHSCHTAMIGGELVEGHVPAETLRRYMADAQMRADYDGLSVPGMPVGSPGMEVEGVEPDSYDIVVFTTAGQTATYESR